jgi:hypothetical protein
MLNLRIKGMMAQLNVVIKEMMKENIALKKENTEFKATPKYSQTLKLA